MLAAPVENTDYEYNLQVRMSAVELDANGNDTPETRFDYEYDASGIRVAQEKRVDSDSDGDFDDETPERTDYLVDYQNPTGYAQVLEESLNDELAKTYTIGPDVFAEAIDAATVRHLLKDGHGSTRRVALNAINGLTAQAAVWHCNNRCCCASVIVRICGAPGGLCGLRRGQTRFSFGVLRSRRSRCNRVSRFQKVFLRSVGDPSRMARRISSNTPRGLHMIRFSVAREFGIAKAVGPKYLAHQEDL